jgi:hypothetical protein
MADVESLADTVRKKKEAKYDHALEAQLREWIGETLGTPWGL